MALKLKEMKHQGFSLKFMEKKPRVFDASDPGCVSADTEFLTPTGWVRIDRYTDELVAQFHPDTREIEFVKPLAYIRKPCDKMIAIAPTRGMSQRLSPEHRVLYYRRDGSHGVKSAEEFMNDLHVQGSYRHDAKFCSTFSVKNRSKLDLSEMQLRLSVAVIADGHFQSETSNRCVIRLKKSRKIQRLQELLIAANVEYSIRNCGGANPDFKVFTFKAPLHDKEFGEWWWSASQNQLEIIADEICYWDSSEDQRESSATRFSSLSEASANFAQYAFAAAKRPAALSFAVRDRRHEDRGIVIEYNVHAQDEDKYIGPGRADSVFAVDNPEGYKYCFEVSTSFLLLRHNGYIFATGNTGKTYVQIMDFARRHKKNKKALLVLCPKSLMRAAWANDIKKFAPHLRVSLCYAQGRLDALEVDADVYIVNVDGVKTLTKLTSKKFWAKFETLVIDESDAYMTPTSQRSKAAAKVAAHFDWRRCLSGTPTGNTICNLWHQYFLLDGGKRLGNSYFKFRSACCTPYQNGPKAEHLKWVDKEDIELLVGELVKDITLRHKFEDCVDIPENHKYSVTYELSTKHRKTYEEFLEHSLAEIDGTVITAVNAAVLAGKLLQAASGAVYRGKNDWVTIDTGRYELACDLAEARKQAVIFYHWDHQCDGLVIEAKKRGMKYAIWDADKPELVEQFQCGEFHYLFAHPGSAGHGLTLTAGEATIWVSPTHNLRHYLQGLKRVHRIGQTKKTETIMILAENTVDENVWDSTMKKNFNAVALLDELQSEK